MKLDNLGEMFAKLTEAHLVQRGIKFTRRYTDEELAEAHAKIAIAHAELAAIDQERMEGFLKGYKP